MEQQGNQMTKGVPNHKTGGAAPDTTRASKPPRYRLAWMPDFAEATNASTDAMLSHFHPIEPTTHPFVTQDEVAHQIVSGARGMGKTLLLVYRLRHLKCKRGLKAALTRAG